MVMYCIALLPVGWHVYLLLWYSYVCSCELCNDMNVETYHLSGCCDLTSAIAVVLLPFSFFSWKCVWIRKQSEQSPHLHSYYTSVISFLLHGFITLPRRGLCDNIIYFDSYLTIFDKLHYLFTVSSLYYIK